MSKKILVLPGDGIGPEIVDEAVKVIAVLRDDMGLDVDLDEALVGGAAYDAAGHRSNGTTSRSRSSSICRGSFPYPPTGQTSPRR